MPVLDFQQPPHRLVTTVNFLYLILVSAENVVNALVLDLNVILNLELGLVLGLWLYFDLARVHDLEIGLQE